MLAARLVEPSKITVEDIPQPALPEGGALVRVSVCGLCGSDLEKIVSGRVAPGVVLGHEVVGVVEALHPEHHSPFSVGDRLVTAHHVPCRKCHYCLNGSESMCRHFKETNLDPGGFAQVVALSPEHLQHTAFRIPDGIDDGEATCVEPLACVLRAVNKAGLPLNGTAVVVGLGFIGLLAAQVYQHAGQIVYGVDRLPARRTLAQEQGFARRAFAPEERSELTTALAGHTAFGRPPGADIVFLTAVTAETLALALDTVRDGGTLVLFASAPEGTRLDPSPLYYREISVVPAYSPSLGDLREAADRVFGRSLQLAPLLTHQLPLSRMEEGVALYRGGEAIKVLISP